MKALLILCLLSIGALAFEDYQFENMTKIEDDFEFGIKVLSGQGHQLVVFNHGYCSSTNERRCHGFEWKLDYFAPKLEARHEGLQVMNMDIRFTNSHRKYRIEKYPAVILFKNGAFLKVFEPDLCGPYRDLRSPDCRRREMRWQRKMLQEILDFSINIPLRAESLRHI